MKTVVALSFGGKSAEHEVSIRSGKNIEDALDKDRLFLPILIESAKKAVGIVLRMLLFFLKPQKYPTPLCLPRLNL